MRVRIVSDGTVHGTSVFDLENGKTLRVSRIEWIVDANTSEPTKCVLTLARPEIDVTIKDALIICGAPATTLIIWPDGREIYCCRPHAEWARRILSSSGLSVFERSVDEGTTCTQVIRE